MGRLFLSVLAGCALGWPAIRANAGSLVLEWRGNLLSVSASEVPMAEVLGAIAKETGLVIEGVEAADSVASLSFTGLRLHEALEDLQRGQSFVLVEVPIEGAKAPRFILSPRGPEPVRASDEASKDSPSVEEILEQGSQAGNPESRIAELEQAMLVGGEGRDADARLLAALNDGDPVVQRYALERFRERGDPRALDMLIQAAADGKVEVRAMLLRDLLSVEDIRVSAVLRDATEDENPEIRAAAFETLAGGGQKTEEVLKERLLHPDPELRMLALMALSAHGPELALEGALTLRNDEDERVRSQVEGLMAELDELRSRQSSAGSSWGGGSSR